MNDSSKDTPSKQMDPTTHLEHDSKNHDNNLIKNGSENQVDHSAKRSSSDSSSYASYSSDSEKQSAFSTPSAPSFLNEGGLLQPSKMHTQQDFQNTKDAKNAKDSEGFHQDALSDNGYHIATAGFQESIGNNHAHHSSGSSHSNFNSANSPNHTNDQSLLLQMISHHLDKLNQELRTARRGRWLGRIILWLFLIILALILFGGSFASNESMVATSHTAVIEIKGEIAQGEIASADNLKYSIKEAFENESSKGIILKINSPGGSPVQAGMIYDEIMRQKKKYPKKRVYAVVEEICASGAYYIAAAADYIYVDKASIIGSIGVLMDGFGFDKTMEKFGVQRRLYTAGSNKGMLDPFSPEKPAQKEHILNMLDNIHQQFITAVKKGRGTRLKVEQNKDLFSGFFWTGEKSIELGLSDGYGYVEDIADRLVREKQLVDYTVQEDFTDKIAKRFGASIGATLGHNLQAMAPEFMQSFIGDPKNSLDSVKIN
jgi:protease IV